jgi:hypothetical protein
MARRWRVPAGSALDLRATFNVGQSRSKTDAYDRVVPAVDHSAFGASGGAIGNQDAR